MFGTKMVSLLRLFIDPFYFLVTIFQAGISIKSGFIQRDKTFYELMSDLGTRSILIVMISSLLFGYAFVLTAGQHLQSFGQIWLNIQSSGVQIIRDFVPLVTALLVTARAGVAVTTELGNMKSSGEVEALIVMGFDPIRFIVLRRFFVIVFMLPCLTMFSNIAGLLGAFLASSQLTGIKAIEFCEIARANISFQDVLFGLKNSLIFAIIIAEVSTYSGYIMVKSSKDVPDVIMRSAVASIFLLIFANASLTAIALL